MAASPGRRLLPVTIDEIAEHNPDRAWASIPVSSSLSDGYSDVSFRSFANAINRTAWFLEATFGRSSNSETIAYIGKSDMRYHTLSMAAAKTGYQVLFSSHINSLAAHLNLFDLCDCKLFLSAKGVDVSDILDARPVKHFLVPELHELLDSSDVEKYPMRNSFDEAANDTFVILHSSGTTGLPKPLPITHAQVAANDQILQLPEDCDCGGPGFSRINIVKENAGRLIVPFAPFHVIASVIVLCETVFGLTTYVFGPADRGMTPVDLLDAVEYGNGDGTFCSPALLEMYASSEQNMARLEKLSTITYGGGVLSPRAAKILTERLLKTRFVQFFGATESGMWALYNLGSEDMDYLSIDACHMGIEWRPVAGESEVMAQPHNEPKTASAPALLHEPVFVRSKDSAAASRQAIFHTFPNLTEYATGDLFAPHPTRPHTWKFAGRTDDLIAFAHGVKFHPAGVEAKIQQGHDRIREVLMWGDRHQQAILLVELNDAGLRDMEDNQGQKAVKSKLDDLIDQVNLDAPVIAQIAKTHVIFVTVERPLPRTSKGSVRRKEAARVYQDEIDEVYRLHGDKMKPMMSRVQ